MVRRACFDVTTRACPGRHLAEMLLFNTMATTLSVFNISAPPDKASNSVPPSSLYSDGGIMSVL